MLGAVTQQQDGYPALLTGLASWWTLDETTGTRVDSHGSNNVIEADPVGYVAGKQGNAADFTGASDCHLYITNPTNLNTGANDWSVALWVNLDEYTAALFDCLLGLSDTNFSSNNDGGMHIGYRGGTEDRFDVTIRVVSTRYNCNASSFGLPSLATWYFLYAYHDASANEIGISINDGTVDTATYTGTPNTKTANLSLGRLGHTGTVQYYLNGKLDEVAWFNRTLTADEITWLYNSGAGRTYGDL